MAVGTKNSNIITTLNSTISTTPDLAKTKGSIFVSSDTFEIVAEDVGDVNDKIVLTRLRSSSRVYSIMIYSDELDTNGSPTLATDCGIYLTDGTVKDSDAFGSAVTTGWGDAAGAGVEFLTEAGATPVGNISKQLWQLAGESSDPGVEYDIALKVTTAAATGASGTLSFVILFTDF